MKNSILTTAAKAIFNLCYGNLCLALEIVKFTFVRNWLLSPLVITILRVQGHHERNCTEFPLGQCERKNLLLKEKICFSLLKEEFISQIFTLLSRRQEFNLPCKGWGETYTHKTLKITCPTSMSDLPVRTLYQYSYAFVNY